MSSEDVTADSNATPASSHVSWEEEEVFSGTTSTAGIRTRSWERVRVFCYCAMYVLCIALNVRMLSYSLLIFCCIVEPRDSQHVQILVLQEKLGMYRKFSG